MNNKNVKNLTYLALLIAVEMMMVMVPFLGFIPIGPLRATTLHIPVIIAGIVLGKKEGCIVGLVFGLSSMIMNTISPTITSFVFSPFISGSLMSAVIAIIPRVLIGYVAGSLYQIFQKKQFIGMVLGSFFGAFTNTILVLGGILLLFKDQYASVIGQSTNALLPYFLSIIASQSLLEAIIGSIISVAVCKVLVQIKK